jgi:hypothetical protein
MLLKAYFDKKQKSSATFIAICLITLFSLAFLAKPNVAGATCTDKTIQSSANAMLVPITQLMSPEYTKYMNEMTTLFYKTCVADGEATVQAKNIIKKLTESTVRWINTGLKGNPLFVQDPQTFFTGIANSAGGKIIESMTPSLCSPFKQNLEVALSRSMTQSGQEKLVCSMTTSGSISGWSGWFQMTQNAQNNPYGASMLASSELNIEIERAQSKEQQQLDWSGGFLPSENCPSTVEDGEGARLAEYNAENQVYDESNQPVYGVWANKSGCLTKTPGATIKAQLDNILNSDLSGLEIAQNIDQIFPPLTGQLLNQTLGGSIGGLVESYVQGGINWLNNTVSNAVNSAIR